MEKRRKRKKSAKERKREKEEEEEAHIKYVRDANKNPQRTRARGRYDLSRLHADTSILISLSLSESLAEETARPLVASMKYIGACPQHPGDAERNDSNMITVA